MAEELRLGGLTYEQEAANPETGWVKLKDQTATSFWIPEAMLRQLMSVDELRRKVDSTRKSVAYYRTERDTYRRLLDEEVTKHHAEQERLRAIIAAKNEVIGEQTLELSEADEQVGLLGRKLHFVTTCALVIVGTLVAVLTLVTV